MADTAALRDAERLLAEADALLAAIDREIAAMKAALATAEEGIDRAESTARETGRHVHWLGEELATGHELQRMATALGADLADRGRRLQALVTDVLAAPPALAMAGAGKSALVPKVATLEVLRPNHSKLEAIELRPLQAREAAWDRIAESHPALGEKVEEALAILDDADALAEDRLAEAAEWEKERERRRTAARPAVKEPSKRS